MAEGLLLSVWRRSRSGGVGKPGMKVGVKLTVTAWRGDNEGFTRNQR